MCIALDVLSLTSNTTRIVILRLSDEDSRRTSAYSLLAKCRSEILRLSARGRSILVGCAQGRRAEVANCESRAFD
jgi:hypothetical protein